MRRCEPRGRLPQDGHARQLRAASDQADRCIVRLMRGQSLPPRPRVSDVRDRGAAPSTASSLRGRTASVEAAGSNPVSAPHRSESALLLGAVPHPHQQQLQRLPTPAVATATVLLPPRARRPIGSALPSWRQTGARAASVRDTADALLRRAVDALSLSADSCDAQRRAQALPAPAPAPAAIDRPAPLASAGGANTAVVVVDAMLPSAVTAARHARSLVEVASAPTGSACATSSATSSLPSARSRRSSIASMYSGAAPLSSRPSVVSALAGSHRRRSVSSAPVPHSVDSHSAARTMTTRSSVVTRAAEAIAAADFLLISAGAGFSADSGLPVYKDIADVPAYLRMGVTYADLCEPDWIQRDPEIFYGFWGSCFNSYMDTQPHAGYEVLRRWCRERFSGDVGGLSRFYVYTSNVDTHFVKAGFPPEVVFPIHGDVLHWQCAKPCSFYRWEMPHSTRFLVDKETMRAPRRATTDILMFSDEDWVHPEEEEARYDAWIAAVLEHVRKRHRRLVILELGCGTRVPTVRDNSESILRQSVHHGTQLIRVNVDFPLCKRFPVATLSLQKAAREALFEIDAALTELAPVPLSTAATASSSTTAPPPPPPPSAGPN